MKPSFALKHRSADNPQFNLTPMIDVVFLLIIFFMLICQFIVQENYKLLLPDDIANAQVPDRVDPEIVTVSVFKQPVANTQPTLPSSDKVMYAVRAERIDPDTFNLQHNPADLISVIAEQITHSAHQKIKPIIHLRADKDLTYGDVQQVLIALAEADMTRVQLAAYRTKQNEQDEPE